MVENRPLARRIDCLLCVKTRTSGVEQDDLNRAPALTSEAYHITVDDGRDSFFALCIAEDDNEHGWLMSDTVSSLENRR